MNRTEKEQSVAALQASFERASVAFVAVGTGLTVATVRELRRSIRKAGGEYKIAKNTLAKLAVRGTEFSGLEPSFKGPTGIVFGYSDPVAVAKVLVKFVEGNDKVSISGGVLERQVLGADSVKALADLPSREVLLAQLLGLLQAPATQLLRTIQEPGARLARVVDALRAKLENN